MKLNKTKLGSIIRHVSEKNSGAKITTVLGISIEKEFMPSVANIIGTDLSKYNVIRKGRFAFNPMHVGRDERLPIALYKSDNPAIVSPAYFMFEIKNPTEVFEDYLLLVFQTELFDHICWFHSDASVRGGLTWEDFDNIEIVLPLYKDQVEEVRRYKVCQERISYLHNENSSLESLIDVLYKKYFSNEEKDEKLSTFLKPVLGGTPDTTEDSYWNGDVAWINSGQINDFRITEPSKMITKEGLKHSAAKMMPNHTVVIAITGVTLGQESILLIPSSGNQSVIGIPETREYPYQYIHPFIKESMRELLRNQTGGAQQHINKEDVKNIPIHSSSFEVINSFKECTNPIYSRIEMNCFEIKKLKELSHALIRVI